MLRDNRGEEEDFWSCWNRTAVQPVAILLRFVTESKNISSTDANKLNDSP